MILLNLVWHIGYLTMSPVLQRPSCGENTNAAVKSIHDAVRHVLVLRPQLEYCSFIVLAFQIFVTYCIGVGDIWRQNIRHGSNVSVVAI